MVISALPTYERLTFAYFLISDSTLGEQAQSCIFAKNYVGLLVCRPRCLMKADRLHQPRCECRGDAASSSLSSINEFS